MSTIADKLQDLIEAKADMKAALQEQNVEPSGGLTSYASAIRQIPIVNGNRWGFKNGSLITPPGKYGQLVYMSEAEKLKDSDGLIPVKNVLGLQDLVWFGLPNWKTTTTSFSFYDTGFTNLVYIPFLECSGLTTLRNTFYNLRIAYCCDLNCPNITIMTGAFYNCWRLRVAPNITTSNVTSMGSTFEGCRNLQSTPMYDAGNVTTTQAMFSGCKNLVTVVGLKNLGKQPNFETGWNGDMTNPNRFAHNMFYGCKKLSRQSCINIFNNLYDRASAGYTSVNLYFEPEVLARLSDSEKQIATNKGWTLLTNA